MFGFIGVGRGALGARAPPPRAKTERFWLNLERYVVSAPYGKARSQIVKKFMLGAWKGAIG